MRKNKKDDLKLQKVNNLNKDFSKRDNYDFNRQHTES